MTKPISANLVAEKNKLSSAGSWVWLLKLDPNNSETIRITSNTSDVSFDADGDATAETWTAFPLEVGEMTEDGGGNPASVRITVGNEQRYYSDILEMNRGFAGKNVTLYLVNTAVISATADAMSQTFRVKSASVTETAAVFDLSSDDVFIFQIPARRFQRKCPKQYKGPLCKYAGAETSCDKTLRGANGCEFHGNVLNYGGCPGIRQ